MINFIFPDFTHPHIILIFVHCKNVHRRVSLTEKSQNCSISSVSHIHCPVLGKLAALYGFGSFEGMNMIFKDCHYFVFIEKWDPMEQSIQEPFWIFVKSLADTIDRDMVVDKFNLIFACLECLPHELLLETIKSM